MRLYTRDAGLGSATLGAATQGSAAPSGGLPFVSGHFARFNTWAEISDRDGRYMERILPGTFLQSIRDNRATIRVLYAHGTDPFIGARPIASLDGLGENAQGGYYFGQLLDTLAARELVPGLAAGLYGSSFRFSIPPGGETWVRNPSRSSYNPESLQERTISRAVLYELGPTTFAAYPTTTAGTSTGAHPPRSSAPPTGQMTVREWADKVMPLPPGVNRDDVARRLWLDRVMPLPPGARH